MGMEDNQILDECCDTQTFAPRDIILPALFEEQVEERPDHTALIFQNHTMSYTELNSRANQIAHYLRDISANKKMLVAVCMKPSFDMLIAILGIIKSGSAYVPLDPDNPASRIQFILDDTRASVILTQSSEASLFASNKAKLLCLDTQQEELNIYSTSNPSHINQPADLAYIIYTSGSTGKPKGVLLTHANVMCFVNWYSKALSITHKDIFDFSSSVSFDFAVANTLFPMMQGATIAICSGLIKKDPYLYLDYLQDNKVSIVKTTPSHFRNLKDVALKEQKNLHVRYMVFGGETLFAADIKDWLQQFPEQTMFCEYGPTEATVATSWIKIDNNNIHQFPGKIPIGKPALNTQLYILDSQLQPVPSGDIAELYIGGKGVAKGYLNRKQITDERFIKNPFGNDRLYKTGDFCRYLPDGNVEFIERIDNQVKIRGFRIEMEEIESLLMRHPDIKEAALIAKQMGTDPTADKQLIAYCVPKKAISLDISSLRDYLKNELPVYMIPSFFEILATFPLNSNGKIDRLNLPELSARAPEQDVMPCSGMALAVKQIWEEALQIQYIKADDNFFDLGGHSLAAARILAKIRQTLKKDISLQDFYSAQTVSELASVIQLAQAIPEQIKITPDSDIIPLSELQFLFWLMRLFYPKAKILNVINRKRLDGNPDIEILNSALSYVCDNHPILAWHVHKFSPVQNRLQLPPPEIEEIDLQHLSAIEQETTLSDSLDNLQYLPWKKDNYLCHVRLFKLGNQSSEIQIALSHFISDELSAGVFFKHLSQYYLELLNNNKVLTTPGQKKFDDYVREDVVKTKANLQKNIEFWESYLGNTSCLYFPDEQRTQDDVLNTSYTEIPDALLSQLQTNCTAHRLCITETLTAAVSTCLTPWVKNKSLAITLVNSTRDQDGYDEAIGPFIRSDMIKADLNQSPDFFELAKRIRQSITDTASWQHCPIIVKLGCSLKKHWENNTIRNKLSGAFTRLYTRLSPKSKLDHRILQMFCNVASARQADRFFININIMNSFVSAVKDTELLSFHLKQITPHRSDKTVDKNILNVWFYRDSNQIAHMILAGNLKSEFLDSLGKDIIDTLSHALIG